MATMTRVTEDHETVEIVARAIYDSIKGCERDGYIGSFDRGHFISIDSNINLITAACAAIKAYRQVCETVPETHEGEMKPCPIIKAGILSNARDAPVRCHSGMTAMPQSPHGTGGRSNESHKGNHAY